MGFLGLGNFGTGFVTGLAKSVDKAVQNDITRVNDRIDKIADIKLRKKLKDEESRQSKINEVQEALEYGSKVLGKTEYAASLLKNKFGNNLSEYNTFVSSFAKEKAKNPTITGDAFFALIDDKTNLTTPMTTRGAAEKIVPVIPSYSTVGTEAMGNAGSLIRNIFGSADIKVDFQNQLTKSIEEQSAQYPSLISEPSPSSISNIEFNDEQYRLLTTPIESRANEISAMLLDTNRVGTAESRAANPNDEKTIKFKDLVTQRRAINIEAGKVGSIDDRIAATENLLNNLNTSTYFDTDVGIDDFRANIYGQITELKDEKEKIEAEASNDNLVKANYKRKELFSEIEDVRRSITLTEEEKNEEISDLYKQVKLNDIKIALASGKDHRQLNTIDTKLKEKTLQLENGISMVGPEFRKTDRGKALAKSITKLTRAQDAIKKLGKPEVSTTELSSASVQIIRAFNSSLTTVALSGVDSIDLDGKVNVRLTEQALDGINTETLNAAIFERQKIILFGGELIGAGIREGILETVPDDMLASYIVAARMLGHEIPKNIQAKYNSINNLSEDNTETQTNNILKESKKKDIEESKEKDIEEDKEKDNAINEKNKAIEIFKKQYEDNKENVDKLIYDIEQNLDNLKLSMDEINESSIAWDEAYPESKNKSYLLEELDKLVSSNFGLEESATMPTQFSNPVKEAINNIPNLMGDIPKYTNTLFGKWRLSGTRTQAKKQFNNLKTDEDKNAFIELYKKKLETAGLNEDKIKQSISLLLKKEYSFKSGGLMSKTKVG